MANTICLSTDMQTLYLIPSSGTSSGFALAGNGVKVSLSAGDVTAKLASKIPTGTETRFSTTKGHWTVFFDNTTNALEMIGIIDMDATHHETYSLSNSSVNIRIENNEIVITQ